MVLCPGADAPGHLLFPVKFSCPGAGRAAPAGACKRFAPGKTLRPGGFSPPGQKSERVPGPSPAARDELRRGDRQAGQVRPLSPVIATVLCPGADAPGHLLFPRSSPIPAQAGPEVVRSRFLFQITAAPWSDAPFSGYSHSKIAPAKRTAYFCQRPPMIPQLPKCQSPRAS